MKFVRRPALVAALSAVLALLGACSSAALALGVDRRVSENESPPREVVVLLHGLGRTQLSMLPLGWRLEQEGYEVLNWGYSSTCCMIDELARKLRADLRQQLRSENVRVHFVGHSLGNIIVRSLLAESPQIPVGRIVMLAPPNQGSHEADRFAPWLSWLLKPLPELRTDGDATVHNLPLPPGASVGIIAASDDGKVSLSETYLRGMTAHVSVPAAHSFLMLRSDVLRYTLEFLREGDFIVSD